MRHQIDLLNFPDDLLIRIILPDLLQSIERVTILAGVCRRIRHLLRTHPLYLWCDTLSTRQARYLSGNGKSNQLKLQTIAIYDKVPSSDSLSDSRVPSDLKEEEDYFRLQLNRYCLQGLFLRSSLVDACTIEKLGQNNLKSLQHLCLWVPSVDSAVLVRLAESDCFLRLISLALGTFRSSVVVHLPNVLRKARNLRYFAFFDSIESPSTDKALKFSMSLLIGMRHLRALGIVGCRPRIAELLRESFQMTPKQTQQETSASLEWLSLTGLAPTEQGRVLTLLQSHQYWKPRIFDFSFPNGSPRGWDAPTCSQRIINFQDTDQVLRETPFINKTSLMSELWPCRTLMPVINARPRDNSYQDALHSAIGQLGKDLRRPSMKGRERSIIERYNVYIRQLCEWGVNPNQRDYALRPALLRAVDNAGEYSYSILETLLSFGADPNVGNAHFETPLYLASLKGLLEIAKKLLEAGARADIPLKNDAWTPFHAAVASGKTELVELLIQREKIDVNSRVNFGQCAVHIAALMKKPAMAWCLLKLGANFTLKDNYGKTPLQLAKRTKDKATIQVFQWIAEREGHSQFSSSAFDTELQSFQ